MTHMMQTQALCFYSVMATLAVSFGAWCVPGPPLIPSVFLETLWATFQGTSAESFQREQRSQCNTAQVHWRRAIVLAHVGRGTDIPEQRGAGECIGTAPGGRKHSARAVSYIRLPCQICISCPCCVAC